MKPETQTDRNINEGSSQSPILTKVYACDEQHTNYLMCCLFVLNLLFCFVQKWILIIIII